LKLTISRFFDLAAIAKNETFKSLAGFFDYQAQLNDNLFRILLNGIGIRDNQDASIVQVSLIPNIFSALNIQKKPLAVYIGSQDTIGKAINSFVWYMDNQNQLNVKITTIDQFYTDAINVTLIIHFS
jgi:hypothetical protein